MADNVPITAGSGTDIATDDVGGVHYQKVKIALGLADAVDTLVDAGQQTMAASVPVVVASDQSAVPVSATHLDVRHLVAADDTVVVTGGAAQTADVKVTLDSEAVVLGAGTAGIGKLTANDGVDIGNVDVASIAAGDNNIGNVDIVTVPADPFGANADAIVAAGAAGSIQAKLRRVTQGLEDLKTAIVLAASTAAIGKLAANTGVIIGAVEVAASQTIAVTQATAASLNATVAQGTAASLKCEPAGNIAHDTGDSGNPLKIGGRADSTFQAAVADGDRVDALFDVYGQLRTRRDHCNNWSYHSDGSSALTDTSVQAAPGAGLSVYITDIVFSTGAVTACNIFFEEGSTKILGPYYLEAVAGRGLALHFTTPKKCTANTALTVTTSAAIAQSLDVTGFIAP